MNYYIKSADEYFIEEEIKEKIGSFNKINSKYNSISKIVEQISSPNFFIEKQVFVIYDISETKKEEKFVKQLINIINMNKNTEDLILIFVFTDPKKFDLIKKDKALITSITNNSQPLQVQELNSVNKYQKAEEYFKKHEAIISSSTIKQLCELLPNNGYQFYNSLEKLMLLKKEITSKDFYLIDSNENVKEYSFAEEFIIGNLSRGYKSYLELKKRAFDPVGMIPIIADKLRQYIAISILKEKGLYNNAIIQELEGMFKYDWEVTKIIKNIKQYDLNSDKLITLLEHLYILDEKIKSGEATRYVEFESLFVLN